jgi:hypothetical protein
LIDGGISAVIVEVGDPKDHFAAVGDHQFGVTNTQLLIPYQYTYSHNAKMDGAPNPFDAGFQTGSRVS